MLFRSNRAKAARLLGISYKALLYKIVDCGLAAKDEVEAPASSETPAPSALEEAFA